MNRKLLLLAIPAAVLIARSRRRHLLWDHDPTGAFAPDGIEPRLRRGFGSGSHGWGAFGHARRADWQRGDTGADTGPDTAEAAVQLDRG